MMVFRCTSSTGNVAILRGRSNLRKYLNNLGYWSLLMRVPPSNYSFLSARASVRMLSSSSFIRALTLLRTMQTYSYILKDLVELSSSCAWFWWASMKI
jgi:hypothetical protein